MSYLPQITIALWLLALLVLMARVAMKPKAIYLGPAQVSRVAVYTAVGAIAEGLTLLAGGFWS